MSEGAGKRTFNLQPSRAFHLVVVVLLMYAAWYIANKYISLTSVPWGVLTILILPIASSATLFHKLSETKKNVAEDLSRDEQRRLTRLIKNKSRATLFMLSLQIFIIIFVALISLGGESESIKEHIHTISKFVVCALVFSLYSLIPVLLGVKEVIDFEGLIKTRKTINKRKKSALTKLGK
ncbi:hypothetical protein [Enterobacter quasiroggenkampii]|uniref:hypothetical protein n=1 Tax=Enterobacter quasiroggenkampii TaxID=2497436 RepID=UPI001F168D75|nr:hypothetical protein [Enterobacter quasiroggenkampii]